METLEPVLVRHPFLQGLPHEYIALLVGCASQARFDTGDFLFRMGEDASSFYLVRHGQVSLEWFSPDRGPVTIETIEQGDALGWSWLIPPYRWELDGRAQTPTLALAFDAVCLRGKLESDPKFGYEMYKRFAPVIASRLQAARLQVLDVHGVRA